MSNNRLPESRGTRNAVESAIDFSKQHRGTWEGTVLKFGSAIKRWEEKNGDLPRDSKTINSLPKDEKSDEQPQEK